MKTLETDTASLLRGDIAAARNEITNIRQEIGGLQAKSDSIEAWRVRYLVQEDQVISKLFAKIDELMKDLADIRADLSRVRGEREAERRTSMMIVSLLSATCGGLLASLFHDKFTRCFAFTVAVEGGFSDSPTDPGNWTGGVVGQGELRGTKFGISAATFPRMDISGLSEDAAKEIYQRDYWPMIQGDALPSPIDIVTFDAAVNDGPRRAVTWLQQAVGVAADGVLGPRSLAAVAGASATVVAREALARRIDYSARLPTWSTFGLGWARRFVALAAELQA